MNKYFVSNKQNISIQNKIWKSNLDNSTLMNCF